LSCCTTLGRYWCRFIRCLIAAAAYTFSIYLYHMPLLALLRGRLSLSVVGTVVALAVGIVVRGSLTERNLPRFPYHPDSAVASHNRPVVTFELTDSMVIDGIDWFVARQVAPQYSRDFHNRFDREIAAARRQPSQQGEQADIGADFDQVVPRQFNSKDVVPAHRTLL
jgi:hypothetical protein